MKKMLWLPLLLGTVLGTLAGITIVTGLSFLTAGITENAIGFYMSLILLATALGGPLAGFVATSILLIISTLFGAPDMKAILSDPINFWSNLLAVGISIALVGLAYRLIFERLNNPVRLLAWAGIVIAYYSIMLPSVTITQFILHDDPTSEILPAVLYGYQSYFPQAIFDIVITSLVFIALPLAYSRPLWYESKSAPGQSG